MVSHRSHVEHHQVARGGAHREGREAPVLGSMTDFALLMDACRGDTKDLEHVALRLAATLCGPLGGKHPADVAVELLGAER